MEISNVIFHQLEKKSEKRGSDTVKVEFATTLLSSEDPVVLKFCEEIIDSYRQQNPIWGYIDEEHKFHNKLESFYSPSDSDFIDFSKSVCDLIKDELATSIFGTGGFVLVLNYTHSGKEWMLVAMLKNDEGYGLTEALALEKRKYLNIKKLHESARINIEDWKNNISLTEEEKKNCLSFMKGSKQKDNDVTEYFRNALGCLGYHSSNKNTKEVISTITKYMDDKGYEPVLRDSVRSSLYSYFDTQNKLDLEVDLETIARKVNSDTPEDFTNYIKENDITIDSSFKPSQRSFKILQKLSFSLGDIRVSFSYDDINDKVVLSEHGLLIKSIPAHIIKEMDGYKPRTMQIPLQNSDE
ncbi:nucleoid-associated protein [Acinetobacter sp. 197]|uniref:nucleoid-associated protein n=1 Tax=Acinetobacter sp. 197 TaxID=3114696 RepID=UPI003A8C0D97